jgi:uncharacterized protein YggT (Ycf19 family)
MALEKREVVQVEQDADLGYERRRQVVKATAPTGQVILARVIQLLWLLAAVIVVLIFARFMMLLIGVSATAPFAQFVYGITDVLVAPFNGLLAAPRVDGAGFIDVASIVAFFVYPLLTYLLTELLRIIFGARRGVRRVSTYERQS